MNSKRQEESSSSGSFRGAPPKQFHENRFAKKSHKEVSLEVQSPADDFANQDENSSQ
jgi:hypothetical protein